jgi:predicted dehydrogenase
MTQVGVGMIGYGFIGKVHAFGYRSIPFYYDPPPLDARLVCVATSRPDTAESAREQGGFAECTADWRSLIERPDIQVVHICSPNSLHAAQLAAAMAAGKHIYCEKPLVSTWPEVETVQNAMKGWKGTGQVTFHNRFYSAMQRARQMVDDGFLGTPLGFRGAYLHSGSVDPSAPMKWRFRKNEGGGVLRDLGSHLLDLLDWLAGPIVEINARCRILHEFRPDGRGGRGRVETEDQAVLSVRLGSGALGTLEASKIAVGAEEDLRLEINGSRGSLRLDVMQPDILEMYSLDDPESPIGGTRGWKRISTAQRYPAPAAFPSPRSPSGWLRGHVHSLYSFLRSVADGTPAEPSISRGIEIENLIACAERSAAEGTWQEVPQGRL